MALAPPISRPAPTPRGCGRTLLLRGAQLVVLVALLGLFALVLWLSSDDFQRVAQGHAERLIERQTGEQLSVSRVDVRLWPLGLEAQGINLFHEPTGETIVSAEKLLVPVVFTVSGPRLGRVQLTRPFVQLHLDDDGLREFRDAVTGGRPLRELPFNGLDIHDGRVRFEHPRGHLELADLQLHPQDGREHALSTVLDVSFDAYERSFPITLAPVLGTRSVTFRAIAVQTEPLDLTGSLEIPLQGDLHGDLSLHAHLDTLAGLLPPPRDVHGELRMDVELRGPPKNPVAVLSAWGTGLGLDAPGKRTPVLHYRFDEMTLAARLTRDRIVVEDLVAYWAGGTLRATGLIDPLTRELVDARVVGDSVSFHDLLRQFDGAPSPWIDMICDAEIRGGGSLAPLHLEASFELDVADLRVTSGPIRETGHTPMLAIPAAFARGDLVLEKDHIRLIGDTVRGPGTRGELDVDIGFAGTLDLTADLVADLSDFQPLGGVQLGGIGPISGRIVGPFKQLSFEGTGDIQQFSVLGLDFADRLTAPVFRSDDLKSLELVGATALLGSSTYGGDFRMDFKPPLSMSTTLDMVDGRVEDVLGVFLETDVSGRMSGGLALDGPLFDLNGGGDFRFRDVDLFGERFPAGQARGVMSEGRFTLDELVLGRRAGMEGLRLRGTVGRGWALDMDLIADGFRLEGLDRLADRVPLRGRLAAYASLSNTLFDPAPAGTLSARDVRYGGVELADSTVEFRTTDATTSFSGQLLGDAVVGSGTLGLWGARPFRIDARLQSFPAHMFHPEGADGSPITAVADGELHLDGAFADPAVPLELRTTLERVAIDWSTHALRNRVPWVYTQTGSTFRLDNFDLYGDRTALAVSATGGERFDLDGEGILELDLLRAVVPGLQRAEGTAAVDLSVERTDGVVDAAVDVEVAADLLRYAAIPVPLEDATATLHLAPDRFDLIALEGSLGGGTMVGSGSIAADQWRPTRYDLRADIDNAQVQWAEALPPAIGDATLRFDGPANALLLEGEVSVDDMVFADRIDWEDWVVEYRSHVLVDSTADTADDGLFDLNLHVAADRTIRLRNNLSEGTASADLRLLGDSARPGIVGWARVDDGIVVLQDRTFRVDRGEVVYNDPFSWDPDLDFDLVTDIESRDQRYRVNYQLYGPFSDWRTSTRSDPGLPQADVNALLWFGVTTDDLAQSGELPTAVAQGVADLLLTDLFASTQASELGEVPDLLFDSIDVATGVNGRGEYSAEPRLVVSKRLENVGDVDLTWEFNLGRPEDNYVRVDKRVGGVWSIAGWYATLQRDRVLPIGGAYGVDITARWEME